MIHIETERLIIRTFESTDDIDLFEYLSLPEIYRFEPGKPIDLAEARELAEGRSQGLNFMAVVLKSENKMIGHLYFEQHEPKEWLTWELGYIFNPKYHRMRYASEAAAALVDYAFTHYHCHRIMARCNPQNTASWKLLEKVGFLREGHFKQVAFFHKDQNGHPIWTDAYEYSMLEKGL